MGNIVNLFCQGGFLAIIKRENIHRPPVFYTFFKNTQFLHFLAGIHLKLHFFSLFHFRLESVKKTNENFKK